MWGAYTFEDWYVVDASADHLTIHACAYSPKVRHFDAISMVMTRERSISRQAREASPTALRSESTHAACRLARPPPLAARVRDTPSGDASASSPSWQPAQFGRTTL